jgi:hypothetical protein
MILKFFYGYNIILLNIISKLEELLPQYNRDNNRDNIVVKH